MEANRAKRIKTKNCSSYKAFGEGKSKQGNPNQKLLYMEKRKGIQKQYIKNQQQKKNFK